MIIEVAKYLSACPHLAGRGVSVNYLDKEEASASLEMIKKRNTVREYADGGVLKAAVFTLALRENFGIGEDESARIAEKCQGIEKWIEEQNLKENLPVLAGAEIAVSVGVSKCFEIVRTDTLAARYEAEIEVIYYI